MFMISLFLIFYPTPFFYCTKTLIEPCGLCTNNLGLYNLQWFSSFSYRHILLLYFSI